MEVGFTSGAGKLEPGSYTDIHTRIGKSDWSVFKPGDDYSQNTSGDLTYFDQVDMFYQGTLVWGKGSISGEGSEGPSGGNNGGGNNNGGNNNGGNNSGNSSPEEEEIIPKGKNNLKLKMYNTGNNGSYANTIHPLMKLVNMGENMVKLSDVTIRYYYTADDDKAQNFWCDWSSAGASNITGTFNKMEESFEGADSYLEIGFTEGASYIDIGATIDIHTRFAKDGWGNYDLTNDHSINPGTEYVDWKKVDVFVDGVKVWGEDLIPSEEEELEVEHMDYADSTYTPVRAEMYNNNRESRSNQISPNFRIYNTQEEPIKLSDLRLNYYYTNDNLNRVIKYTDGNDSITQYQYSMNGNVIKVIDPLGNAQKVEYNKDGKVIKEINQNGHSKSYSYDKITGLLSGITNELLGIEKYQYDTMGKLTMEIATDGGVTLYDYDLLGRIKSVTNPEGGKYTFKYDCKGNTIEEKDEEGNVINYSYDKLNRVVEETDALNNTTKYTYDKMGKVVEIKNPSGGVTKHEYDKLGNITKTTDATGNITKNTYNKVGLLESITDAEGNKTSYKYDYEGNKTEEVNALGNTTIWKYNKDGSLHKEIDANGNSTTYQYDQLSRVKVSTDPLGNSIQYEYDAVGNKISETDALGNKTSFKYDEQNNLIYITNPSGKSASYQYDAKGQIINETDPNGNITLYSYDKNGNVEKIINALGDTSNFIYDNTNKLLEEIDANGNRITYQYDADGNNIKTTDARGAVTVYEYDKDNNLTQVKNSLNQIIKYEYDYLGNVIQEIREGQTSSTNQITHYKYNKNGLLTDIIDSMGNSTTYVYNSIGLLSSERSKEGKETKYFYDKVGNLNKVIYSDNRNVSFIYDKNNNIETIKDWNGITSYNYNANGQVVKIIDANNQAIEYTWTKLGQKKSIKYPTGDTVKYTYDNNGNIARVTDTNNGITTYTYDALNQVKTKQLPNGVQSSYNYDKNGWLIKREENGREVSKQTYSYEYDKNGNRTKETKTSSGINETIRYVYDVLNQLISVTDKKGSRAYTFDEFNNRIQKQETGKGTIQYKYNNLNQLVETTQGSTVTTYDYDRRGNLEEVEENGDTIQTYTFDSTNKMSKAVISKDDKNGDGSSNRKTVTSKYTYDGVGNRINAKIETNGSVTSNTTYVVDPESSYNDIIMAKDSVSGKTSIFTFSDEVISVETSGTISYYRNDEKNSVTDILDTTGMVKDTIEYDEYGVIANPEVVSTGGNIFAYTGHVYDKSTKLYYAKARYYDAGIGRFVSEDSYRGEQEELLSLNLYIYVQNNPIKYIDPSGNVTRWEGIQAHKYLQIYFKYLYLRMHKGMSGWIEYNIDSKRFKKGKGRADIVLHLLKTNVFEIYEIKPFNTRQQIEGRKQLKSYIGALREKEDNVRAGITFNPNGLAIVCKWDKNKVIRYETHPSDPGMIYYRIIERNDKYKEVGTVYNTEKQITINYGQVLYEGLAMIAVASIIYLGVIYTVSTLGTGPIWTLPMRALLQ